MLRFIWIILFFSSTATASVSVDPNYFHGHTGTPSELIQSGNGPARFTSVSSICDWATSYTHDDNGNETIRYENLVQNSDHCNFDLWLKNHSTGEFYFFRNYDSGWAVPKWDECLFVDSLTNTCQTAYPSNFDTYTCSLEFNTKWGNEITVCGSDVPLCTGESQCKELALELNECLPFIQAALDDPFLDYVENWVYTDDDNFSISCDVSDSDRTVSDDVPNPWVDLVNPVGPDGSSTQSAPDDQPSVTTIVNNPAPTQTTPDIVTDPDLIQAIDDSQLIEAVDSQTYMINGQLNQIGGAISAIDDEGIIRGLDNQTAMINGQLNQLGRAITDSTDNLVLQAVNNQIQTTEDLLDLLGDDRSSEEILERMDEIIDYLGFADITVQPTDIESSIDTNKISEFNTDFENTPIMLAFDNAFNLMNFDNPECPELVIDLTGTLIKSTIQSDIFCDLLEQVSGPLGTVMLACWTFLGFRIFATA
jgi:hypothetical protein